MMMTGGEAVVRMMQLYGVEFSFGMGGFQALPYYDALARQEQVRHILIRDEKHGAFAADGYARVRNRPAVADATLGPGATNLISGAAESFGASVPLILLTGEVNSSIAGRGATQESDQLGMLRPTCKDVISVTKIERIPELMRRAFSVATAGRPGPVNLNIPEEVFHAAYDFSPSDFFADSDAVLVGGRRVRPDAQMVERAAALINAAERPVAILGGGIHLSAAYDEVAQFADQTGMPIATTISGKGALAEIQPMAVGLCGRYSRTGNDLVKSADLVVVVGSKLGEIATNRWTLLAPGSKLVQIDIDPTELGKVYPVSVGIWGDAKLSLADLNSALRTDANRVAERKKQQREEVIKRSTEWFAGAVDNYNSPERPIHMARLLHELRQVLPTEAILVADGGFAAHWSALLFDVHVAGRSFIANRGHAAIGYGLPGAIGAKLASPATPVVALCGDNGFAMAVAELETAKRVGAPVICVVVNNRALGYVKALQHSMYDDRFLSVDFLDVDYSNVAQTFGCAGTRVNDADQLSGALAAALEAQTNCPFVIDVLTTTDPAKMLPGIDSRTRQAK